MRNRLTKLYTQPNSYLYNLLDYLNNHQSKINTVIILIIIIPTFYYFKQHEKYKKIEELKISLSQELNQYSAKLLTMQKHYNTENKKDTNLAKTTEKIRTILTNNGAKEENIQWQFLEQNYVYVTASHRTSNILKIINEINQLDILKYKEINLIRLNREKLVQLNATLVLND